MTQWILCDKFQGPEPIENEQITSLLFILSSNVPQPSLLSNISSLIFLPPKPDLGKPLSPQFKEGLKSIMNSQCPNLKHLLLKCMNFHDPIEDFISISQLKLDRICIWDSEFRTSDLIWSVLIVSIELVRSAQTDTVCNFRFTIRANEHTTQVIWNKSSSFPMPNSPDLIHGLILSLGQDFPDDISLNTISLLTLFSSKIDVMEPLSPQAKQSLKFILSPQGPKLRHLFLKNIDFDDNIEEFVSSSQSRLDLIYLWNCNFKTLDPIWTILIDFVGQASWMTMGQSRDCRCAIQMNGHTTQLVANMGRFFVMPNSPALPYGLILSSDQNIPSDLLLDAISCFALIPSKMGLPEVLSPKHKQYLESIMNRQSLNLKYLLLAYMKFDGNIEDFISISRSKLHLIHLRDCEFTTNDLIWSILASSVRLASSSQTEGTRNFRFIIKANERTTQVIWNDGPGLVMPNSPDLIHGLILASDQNIPSNLLLNYISCFALIPSKMDLPEVLSPKHKQYLNYIVNRQSSNLKYLFLAYMKFDDNIEDFISISRLKLHLIYLRNCEFTTKNLIWSVLLNSAQLASSAQTGGAQDFRFTIRAHEHTTQVIWNNSSSFPMPNSPGLVHGLILSSDQNIPSDLLLDDISGLSLIPSKMGLLQVPSPEHRQYLESIMNRQSSNLKYLLLAFMKFDGKIEDFISISRSKLHLIYLRNCGFTTKDLIWSALRSSVQLASSAQTGGAQDFRFTIRANEHTTQVIWNYSPGFVMPNSPDLIHGLILSSDQNIPSDLLLDDISGLSLIPSKMGLPQVSSFRYERYMKPIIDRKYPNLKCLFLAYMKFDDNIEDFIPISRLKLDLIYLRNCDFKTNDLLWSALASSMRSASLAQTEGGRNLQFTIREDEHTTQVIWSNGPSFPMPNSPDLIHGLILASEKNIPSDSSLDNISCLALIPSKMGLPKAPSPKHGQYLKSIMNRQYPNLKHLFLGYMKFEDDNIEDFVAVLQPKLDMIYIWNSIFMAYGHFWSALADFRSLLSSMHEGKFLSFQFTIRAKTRTTQIVHNRGFSFLMPNSPGLVHGLILSLGQDFPDDISSDTISFLALLPSERNTMEILSLHSMQSLASSINHRCPKVKYLLLKRIYFDGNIEEFISILQPKLDLIYLQNCGVKTNDPIWSVLDDSMRLFNTLHKKKIQTFQFAIPFNGHTTQILINESSYLVMPNSSDLIQGLILHLGQVLPDDLPLNNISFLVLLSTESDPREASSSQIVELDPSESLISQLKKSLASIKRLWPRLENLLLKGVFRETVLKLSCFDQQSGLKIYDLLDSASL